jgi:hypothetical protein
MALMAELICQHSSDNSKLVLAAYGSWSILDCWWRPDFCVSDLALRYLLLTGVSRGFEVHETTPQF